METRPATPSGFPGARPPAEPTSYVPHPGEPCPLHPTEHHPCGRCANARRPTEEVADTITAIRRSLRPTAIAPATPTEESQTA